MSILGSANYLINAVHKGDVTHETYVGNFDELRRTIATTYSQIPHLVRIVGNVVQVTKEGTEEVLSTFDFTPFESKKLPDHF